MANSDVFLDKYKHLEAVIKANFGLAPDEPAVAFLERSPSYKTMKEDLRYCRNVRNLLSHNRKVGGEYAVEVSAGMLDFLDLVIEKVESPKRARDIFVPMQKVLSRSYEDNVLEAMTQMSSRNISKLPILKDGVVVGIFSENTLMSYLIHHKKLEIQDDMTFADLQEYLPLEKQKARGFLFVSADTLLSDVVAAFDKAQAAGKRLGFVLVTQNGRSSEKLMGIISGWEAAVR